MDQTLPLQQAHAQLEAMRPQLLKIAQVQLRNATWAEDAVSETLLSAIEKLSTFDGRSQLKTWVIAILRNKVIDQMRRNAREVCIGDEDASDEDVEALVFDARGRYREAPTPWASPDGALSERQFLSIVEACVERLPNQLGRVFLMREWLDMETEEICKEIGLTTSNLWVMLHRARLRLRECVQVHWQGREST